MDRKDPLRAMTIEPINDFEHAARRRKAEALATAYYGRAVNLCRRLDQLSVAGPRTDEEYADHVLAMVREAKPRMWMSLARTEHIPLPSTKTMALAQSIVADRAHQARGDYR